MILPFMPPYIFITILLYLVVLLVILLIFKEKNIKKTFSKSLLTILTTNLFAIVLIYFLSLLNNDLKNSLFYNRVDIYIILLLILIMLISGFINYVIHKKYIIKDNKLLCLIISIIFIPYMILVPLKEHKNLTNYKNTNIGDNSKVSTIIELLDLKKTSMSLQTTNEPYVLTINLDSKTSIIDIYESLENKAAIMFNLINNVSIINYNYNEKIYIFEFDKLNKIYQDLRNIDIDTINKRYDNFNDDYIYMGHINGYDIFDESITCESEEFLIKKENNINYYITCSNIDHIFLYKDNEKYKLKDKFNDFKLEDLLKTNLHIYQK